MFASQFGSLFFFCTAPLWVLWSGGGARAAAWYRKLWYCLITCPFGGLTVKLGFPYKPLGVIKVTVSITKELVNYCSHLHQCLGVSLPTVVSTGIWQFCVVELHVEPSTGFFFVSAVCPVPPHSLPLGEILG